MKQHYAMSTSCYGGNQWELCSSVVGDITHYNEAQQRQRFLQQLVSLQGEEAKRMASGTKPVVVCNGKVTEAKDMEDAQRIAEREAHSQSTDAFILKPTRRVSPKRDVVSTDL